MRIANHSLKGAQYRFDPASRNIHGKRTPFFRVLKLQDKVTGVFFDGRMERATAGRKFPVTVVGHLVPKAFFQDLAAGLETPVHEHLLVVGEGQQGKLRDHMAPSRDFPILAGCRASFKKTGAILPLGIIGQQSLARGAHNRQRLSGSMRGGGQANGIRFRQRLIRHHFCEPVPEAGSKVIGRGVGINLLPVGQKNSRYLSKMGTGL